MSSVLGPVLLALLLALAPAECQTVDAFKMIGGFPEITAIYGTTATTEGQDLQCLHAVLTEYNPDEGKSTYVWFQKNSAGTERSVEHRIIKGDSPDQVIEFSADDPGTAATATVYYTDYETCFVLNTEVMEGQCILWVNSKMRNRVPQECIRKYEESCGEGVLLYDQEVC